MPERTPYDEAMLLSQARLKVPDLDLKQGKVETITVPTNAGPMQRPWGVQGGFAVVYKFRTQSGKVRALRCFLVQMTPDTQFRYERISSYFAVHAPDITVDFKYYDSGIVLKEQVYGQMQSRTYPVIEMEWIEGVTLIDRVDELCKKRDRAGLKDLVNQWLAILRTLRSANISHGDLAGVNVMVRPNGRMVLVDYDGIYIPDFAGLPQIVLGQADYQHPQMNLRPFNERTDDFSAMVIYTALLALQIRPELWNIFTHCNAQGVILDTNLLFKQQDFVDPDRSLVFTELEQISDPRIKQAVQKLKQACRQSVTQVVFEASSAEEEALAKLEQAIKSDDDEQIVKAWISKLLDNYAPAQQYVGRVAQARQVVQALQRFHDALQTGSLQQIVSVYDPIVNKCKGFTLEQAEQLLLALEFMQAYRNDDDQALVFTWETIENSRYKGNLALTAQEQERIALAGRRKEALVKFRLGLMNKSIQHTVAGYDASLLDACTSVTPHERELLQVAQDFVQAYQRDDDQGIVAACEAIQNFTYRTSFAFTAQEQQRIALAQQRKIALMKFRLGLMSKNVQQIIANYDWILDDCKNITLQELDILRLAKDFVRAYHRGDDEPIAAVAEGIQKACYQKFFAFNTQEQQRIDTIQQRKAALAKFRVALNSKSIQQMVADYDAVLDDHKSITQQERKLLELARRFVEACQQDDDQAIVSTWEEIQEPHYMMSFTFTEQEQQRITLAQQRKTALIKFRIAAMNKNVQQIVAAYDPLLDGCGNITQEEQKQIALAHRFVQAYQNDDDRAILSVWRDIQNSPYQKSFVFTAREDQRITLARTRDTAQGRSPHA